MMQKKPVFPAAGFFIMLLCFFFASRAVYGQSGFFWEQAEIFTAGQGNFPVTAYNGNLGAVVWQEPNRRPVSGSEGAGDGSITISLAVKVPGRPLQKMGLIGGPYVYSGTEPSILSLVIDERDRIIIAAAAAANQTEVLISEDYGRTFERHRVFTGTESSLAPRIAVAADGSYLLFVTRGSDSSLSIYYSRSTNGRTWSTFVPFVTDEGMRLNFLPSHASFGGREYVVFQSFTGSAETVPAFQLFFKTSDDNGRTWTPSRRFTQFRDAFESTSSSPDFFDNQRPHLSVQGDTLFLVWERRFRTNSPHIYAVRVGADGVHIGSAERVSAGSAYCNNPIAFNYQGVLMILWFDNRRGPNRIFMAQQLGLVWDVIELPGLSGGEASFGRPIVDRDGIFLFWQNTLGNTDRIVSLLPDTTVSAPGISTLNFTSGSRIRGDTAELSWNIPGDSSGIQGFSYLWTQNEDETPDRIVRMYNTTGRNPVISLNAAEDGIWYFSVMALDYAGNWSSPSRVEFIRDTTPPPAASVIAPDMDDNGYLLSNTFTVRWNLPPASDIAAFAWNLEYLDADGRFPDMAYGEFTAAVEELYSTGFVSAPRMQGTQNFVSYTNQDNGVWRFSVRAVDVAGNAGPLSTLIFRTNKYIDYTYITHVDAVQDQQGFLNISIIGRGFSEGGNITRIFLDMDGIAPYDREFLLRLEDYSIVSDREIRNLRVEDLDEGTYRIGLEHSRRGIYFSPVRVRVTEMGTVKFGDYSASWKPSWITQTERRFSFNTGYLILALILALCMLGLIASVWGIGKTITEGAAIRLDAAALITGDLMPSEMKKRIARIKKRGVGLSLKLASFTIALVIVVVAMISIPLSVIMTRNTRETLLRGLWDRSVVLLEGLATNARAHIPMGSVLELGLLPAQMNSVPEARYVTITGISPDTPEYEDRVWASNDPDILRKIDTSGIQPGVSRITDVLSPGIRTIAGELNERARLEVGSLSESIVSLNREGQSLARSTDEASMRRLEDIDVQARTMQTMLGERLSVISSAIGSVPAFSLVNFTVSPDNTYIFFKPIMYRQGSEDIYFRGLVRLEVSIESILDEIANEQRNLIAVILLFALAAQGVGVLGATLLSALIIRPIRQLVSHVEIIRDTEDKAMLNGVDIKLKSKDELSILGDTINDMTHGLVKAAAAAADLSIGREIQKKFIPLELDKEGNKLSYGSKDTKNLTFFGYYEGAKGVSGDYFDYQDLDGRYYAIIKCDVAGKGIPAALIMIQVATMFLNYFKQWKPNARGMHIEDVVYQINDFIETLGFKGRFAAFSLCLYDSQTGVVRFCNAGDNIIHLFDASEGRVKTVTLPESPATGVLPNFMVESKGGYGVQTLTLDHGDILLLYTDGIEEAKRLFRDSNFREIICTEGETDTPHATHTVGQWDEEMGSERVEEIINSVMNKQIYTLRKWHNPEGEDKKLQFDFTTSQGSVEEVIMAMVSVEKMFRCYREPGSSAGNMVLVDKTVDAFLKKHFLQYRDYCSMTRESPGNTAYICYTHVKEDEQYDDLTLLGIKRK